MHLILFILPLTPPLYTSTSQPLPKCVSESSLFIYLVHRFLGVGPSIGARPIYLGPHL